MSEPQNASDATSATGTSAEGQHADTGELSGRSGAIRDVPAWLRYLAPSMDHGPLPVVTRDSCVDSQGNYRGTPEPTAQEGTDVRD